MKDWFLSLTQRERIMVQVAVSVTIIFMCYLLVVEPISHNYSINKKNVAAAIETLDWMKSAAREVKQLGGEHLQKRQTQGKQFTLSLVDSSARKAGLASVMKRVQPEGDLGVRIWFESAPFDELINWLAILNSQHGLSVNEINVEQTESTGLVNVRVFLEL